LRLHAEEDALVVAAPRERRAVADDEVFRESVGGFWIEDRGCRDHRRRSLRDTVAILLF
jgi:hypothetical protein